MVSEAASAMALRRTVVAIALAACQPSAPGAVETGGPRRITLEVPGGIPLLAERYGGGERGVVILAHGGYSTLASWAPQARAIADAGFQVLVVEARAAVDLAAGRQTDCLYDPPCLAKDVLAGVRNLWTSGARSVALMGGSMGGAAAAQASVEAQPGEVERLILLAPAGIAEPDRMQGDKLFITTRDDANAAGPRLPGIQAQFDRSPEPKRLIVLDGSAHAQRIFLTPDGDAVMREILRFLATR